MQAEAVSSCHWNGALRLKADGCCCRRAVVRDGHAAVALPGWGSVFHPESSRVRRIVARADGMLCAVAVSRWAANGGSARDRCRCLHCAAHRGHRESIACVWAAAMSRCNSVAGGPVWYKAHLTANHKQRGGRGTSALPPRARLKLSLAVLVLLVFSKMCYLASITVLTRFY